MIDQSNFQVLVLEGSPRERGRIHGESLRAPIHEMIALWKENIRADLNMNPDDFLAQFIDETNFLPAIKRWTPDLLEEVAGIAEGARVDFNTVLARQLSDEEPWFRLEKKLGRSWGNAGHCSAIGVNRQGTLPALAAQNMDTPAYYDGFQVLLHIKHLDSPLEVFMFTIAGKINLAGMNNAPVAICCNTVLPLDYAKDGLPEDFVVRGALAQPSLADALRFLNRVKHASGQNYVIGGPEKVLSLECSANKVVEYIPYPGANRVFHTNHPLVNDDQGIYRQRLALMADEERGGWRDATGARTNTHDRFDYLQQQLSDPQEVITIDRIKSVLSSHDAPVCHHSDKKISLGCLIMELSEQPKLHLAPGPPCKTPFQTHALAEITERIN
ncbi:MAG: C45 family autoproteolytic acyltransferase/hydrolase [Chloroflexi bacterium]|nr:C45 family autoproteolytic acyltransferase/hydrolase [Chloroflexota bacterium]